MNRPIFDQRHGRPYHYQRITSIPYTRVVLFEPNLTKISADILQQNNGLNHALHYFQPFAKSLAPYCGRPEVTGDAISGQVANGIWSYNGVEFESTSLSSLRVNKNVTAEAVATDNDHSI